MMAKLLCVPFLVLFVSASLALQNSGSLGQTVPNEPPSNPTEFFDQLFDMEFNPKCQEWETIELTIGDIDISNPDNVEKEEAITIKTGNLKDHKVPFQELYDYNNKTGKVRACACHIEGTLCIPLCCKLHQQGSMKDGKLTCVNTTEAEDHIIYKEFDKHIRNEEKLGESNFVIVHHNGLNSLNPCDDTALSYRPSKIFNTINPEKWIFNNDHFPEPQDYCYLPEKNGKAYEFTPVYCTPAWHSKITPATKLKTPAKKSETPAKKSETPATKSETPAPKSKTPVTKSPATTNGKSAGFQTTPPPLAIIYYSIASIVVLFLTVP